MMVLNKCDNNGRVILGGGRDLVILSVFLHHLSASRFKTRFSVSTLPLCQSDYNIRWKHLILYIIPSLSSINAEINVDKFFA